MTWVSPTLHALSLCLATGEPAAAEPDEGSTDAPTVSDAEAQAQALFGEGTKAYETADYPRAIELFEAALTPPNAAPTTTTLVRVATDPNRIR